MSGGGGQGLRQEKQLRLLLQGLGYLMMSQDLVQTSSRMTFKKKQYVFSLLSISCFPFWAFFGGISVSMFFCCFFPVSLLSASSLF